MEVLAFRKVIDEICLFLDEHGIEHKMQAVCEEKEWTDFRLNIKDPKQMERINTWLQEDLKHSIIGCADIQISAPNPVLGKENELRIRIYELD